MASVRVELYASGLSDQEAIRAREIFLEAKATALHRFHRGDRPSIAVCPDSIDRFLRWKKISGSVGQNTIDRMRNRLKTFADIFADRPVSAITSDDMVTWHDRVMGRRKNVRRYHKDAVGLSPDTICKYLHALRQFCAWARDEIHAAPPNLPCERFRVKVTGKINKDNRYPPKCLTYPEIVHVIKMLHRDYPHIGLVIRGMLLFGARPVQLFRLRRGDLSMPLQDKKKRQRPGMLDLGPCKGAPERSIPIPYDQPDRPSERHKLILDCISIFEKFRGRKPRKDDFLFIPFRGRSRSGGWSCAAFDHRLEQVCKKLQIKDFVAYVSRHTLGTLLQQNGCKLATVQATMGHSKVTTQNVYGHRTSTDALEGLDLIEKMMPTLKPIKAPEIVPDAPPELTMELPFGLSL